jgi:hypothetical protein
MAKKSPARILRSKGLIPGDWNLTQLTGGQKSYITKQAKRYSDVVRNPEDYVSRRVSQSTAKLLKGAQYTVKGQRVLLHTPGADKVSIARGKVRFVRQRQSETVLLQSSPDFLRQLERLDDIKAELPPGQYVGFKIGDSQVIGTFKTIEEAYYYATGTRGVDHRRGFEGMDAQSVALVLIDRDEGWEDDDS